MCENPNLSLNFFESRNTVVITTLLDVDNQLDKLSYTDYTWVDGRSMRAHGGFVKRISGTDSDDDFKAYILPTVSKIDFVRQNVINTPVNEEVSVTGSENKLKFKLENKIVVYELCKSSIVDIDKETPDNDKMIATENLLNGAVTPVEPSAPVTVPEPNAEPNTEPEPVNDNKVNETEGVNETTPGNNNNNNNKNVKNETVPEASNEPEVTAPEPASTPVAEENAEPKPETPAEPNKPEPVKEEENKPKEGIIEKALRTINNGLNNFTPFGAKNNKPDTPPAEPVEPVKSPVATPIPTPVNEPKADVEDSNAPVSQTNNMPTESVTAEDNVRLLKIKPTDTVLPEQLKEPVNSEVKSNFNQVGEVNMPNNSNAEEPTPEATSVEPEPEPMVTPVTTPVEPEPTPEATPVAPNNNTPESVTPPVTTPVTTPVEPELTPVTTPVESAVPSPVNTVTTPLTSEVEPPQVSETSVLEKTNSIKSQPQGSLLVGGKSKKRRYTRGSHSRRIKTI